MRVATVPGRVRSWPGSDTAAASRTPSRAIRSSAGASFSAPSRYMRTMFSSAAMCMFTPIASEASARARRLEATTTSCRLVDAHPAEVLRDRRGVVAGGGEPVGARVRVAPVAVVGGRERCDLERERLGERDQARAGLRAGGRAAMLYAAIGLIATGTPLATMSNTAERFCAFSTIARSFSAGASPLIVNVPRICVKPLR